MIRIVVPLAAGVEEMEAVIAVDVFRRAGFAVAVRGLRAGPVRASRGVVLQPDDTWDGTEPETFDALVLPGGAAGTEALKADGRIVEAVRRFVAAGKWVAAICAAPLVLDAAGVLAGRRATCHPAARASFQPGRWEEARVVVDGRIVTSQGPGTAFDFALTLVRLLGGEPLRARVAQGLVLADASAGA
jgi:4-methyl-5(b-hydroxyethyl)-thiazole monophosphate biosynthesis